MQLTQWWSGGREVEETVKRWHFLHPPTAQAPPSRPRLAPTYVMHPWCNRADIPLGYTLLEIISINRNIYKHIQLNWGNKYTV